MRHEIQDENTCNVDLTKNECLFPSIAQKILKDVFIEPNDLIKYHSAYEVENFLSEKLKSFVFSNNGSEQVIKQIIEILSKECNEWVIPSPTFELVNFYCNHYDCKIYSPKYKYDELNDNFSLNFNDVPGDTKNQILYIVSPHNPTGITLSLNDIDVLCKKYKYLIIDEAYVYPDNPILIPRKNLIYIRTFSKMGGLTGLRFGFGICFDKQLYKRIFQIRPMYINSFTLKCVNYILKNNITDEVKNKIKIQTQQLRDAYSCAGNFALFKNKTHYNTYPLKKYSFNNHTFYRMTIHE